MFLFEKSNLSLLNLKRLTFWENNVLDGGKTYLCEVGPTVVDFRFCLNFGHFVLVFNSSLIYFVLHFLTRAVSRFFSYVCVVVKKIL